MKFGLVENRVHRPGLGINYDLTLVWQDCRFLTMAADPVLSSLYSLPKVVSLLLAALPSLNSGTFPPTLSSSSQQHLGVPGGVGGSVHKGHGPEVSAGEGGGDHGRGGGEQRATGEQERRGGVRAQARRISLWRHPCRPLEVFIPALPCRSSVSYLSLTRTPSRGWREAGAC